MSTQETRGHVPADHVVHPEGIQPSAHAVRDVIAPMGAPERTVNEKTGDQTPEQVAGQLAAAGALAAVRMGRATLPDDGIVPLRKRPPLIAPDNYPF